MKTCFLYFQLKKKTGKEKFTTRKGKKRYENILVDDDELKVIPNFCYKEFQGEEILNEQLLVLYVDWNTLDEATEGMGLEFKWRETYFDPTGKYDSPNMRLYLAALQRYCN